MENKAYLIKMIKKVDSKVELAKNIISLYICFNDLTLSDTEKTVLAYFMVYGINTQTKELIVESQICKNIFTVKTVMSKLKKKKLIYKDEDFSRKVYVIDSLKFDITSTVAFYLKIDID